MSTTATHTDSSPDTSQDTSQAASRPHRIMAAYGALGTSVALIIGIIADPSSLEFVLPPLILGIVTGVLALRFGTWSKVLAGVWGLAALAMLPATPVPLGMVHPDSLFDFVPGWLFALSAVTALVGGVIAVVRRTDPGPVALERRWIAAVGAVMAGMVAISGLMSISTDSSLTAEERAGAIEIVLTDSGYAEDAYQLPSGDITFAVSNSGNVLHTVTIDELGIDETLSPGQEILVQTTISDLSTFEFYCRPHSELTDSGRDGMFATATVS